jgi:hypothetical protein
VGNGNVFDMVYGLSNRYVSKISTFSFLEMKLITEIQAGEQIFDMAKQNVFDVA